ncbi:MAG: hypothetical protein N2486_06585 [Caloramator sp.]|nr:hypothetical protein [Caloramator sp.]
MKCLKINKFILIMIILLINVFAIVALKNYFNNSYTINRAVTPVSKINKLINNIEIIGLSCIENEFKDQNNITFLGLRHILKFKIRGINKIEDFNNDIGFRIIYPPEYKEIFGYTSSGVNYSYQLSSSETATYVVNFEDMIMENNNSVKRELLTKLSALDKPYIIEIYNSQKLIKTITINKQ